MICNQFVTRNKDNAIMCSRITFIYLLNKFRIRNLVFINKNKILILLD